MPYTNTTDMQEVCKGMRQRNDEVDRFLKKILERVHILATLDADAGREWRWRYEDFQAVPYQTFFESTAPLFPPNFWKDLAFLFESPANV